MKKIKMPKGKVWLWIAIGAISGFIAFHFIGLAIGIICGWYIGRKI